ncbi:hypothetical protein [Thalassovita sp.]|uniref:hypothetical protein n=1 Tax=Thalassovita sp. TaxID=1979401 RepID=UPI00288167A8|nr:hypothetical protein [Thalassovita sp.]MDF1803091.1 hypothetical protein [Thalassovita sp.]
MQYHVERMLSSGFLLDLGTFIQTFAHIELSFWEMYLCTSGCSPRGLQKTASPHLRQRLSTRNLVRNLRKHAAALPANIAFRVHLACIEYERLREARNTAAHGAWYSDGETLRVEHYFESWRSGAAQWYHVPEEISKQQIREAVLEANQLLGIVIHLRDSIEELLFPKRKNTSTAFQMQTVQRTLFSRGCE